MKIKRFEAQSMSDALRAVKKEFGDDAVILSAKTVKKTNRLFNGKRKTQVVVTAAIDRTESPPVSKPAPQTDTPKDRWRTEPLSSGQETDGIENSTYGIAPISRTGQKKLLSKFVRFTSEIQKPERDGTIRSRPLAQRLEDQGIETHIAKEWADQVGQLSPSSGEMIDGTDERLALSHIIKASNLVDQTHKTLSKQRKIILVGPSGVGKTTMAAKLAAAARMHSQSVTILSLDNYRIAGTEELRRYASIIGFNFQSLYEADEIHGAFDQCQKDDLVIVDTPGVGLKDDSIRKHLLEMINKITSPEIHLVLNAGAQNRVMTAMLDFFKPLGVQHLAFTHLDWIIQHGPIVNAALDAGLSISYVSQGNEIPDGLQAASVELILDLLYPQSAPISKDRAVTVIHRPASSVRQGEFLANSNSDIFHRPECRSVQRINNDNILTFSNELDAMAQSFKPCRMCCPDLLGSKSNKPMTYGPHIRGRYSQL